jgi:hypothetical protein
MEYYNKRILFLGFELGPLQNIRCEAMVELDLCVRCAPRCSESALLTHRYVGASSVDLRACYCVHMLAASRSDKFLDVVEESRKLLLGIGKPISRWSTQRPQFPGCPNAQGR